MTNSLAVPDEKIERLYDMLAGWNSALVAFSGGVDSTLMLHLARKAYGEKTLAVTVRSAGIPAKEAEEAQQIATELGVRHMVIEADVLSVPEFAQNAPNRCYACKLHVFGRLTDIAAAEGIDVVLDGSNADDVGDYRPGMIAAQELGVRSPLQEAGITKQEVRAMLRKDGFANWDKPATPCLATRFPYGATITAEAMQQVWLAEDYLRGLGFRQVRVRHHGDVARIEAPVEEVSAIVMLAKDIVAHIRDVAGFRYVTLDLQGFRSGSMNEGLAK